MILLTVNESAMACFRFCYILCAVACENAFTVFFFMEGIDKRHVIVYNVIRKSVRCGFDYRTSCINQQM